MDKKEKEQHDPSPSPILPSLPLLMEDRTIADNAQQSITGTQSSIASPTVHANTFEIKPNIIWMVQNNLLFYGLPKEDPNAHILNILEVCDTFKINRVSDDIIRLCLFPLSLRN